MWRRLAQLCVVWISLSGLVPAAFACAQTMPERDCCPPGQQMPCDNEQTPKSNEATECCLTPNLAPAAVSVASEQAHAELLPLDLLDAPAVAQPISANATYRGNERIPDPPDVSIDSSRIYLQTGRLRL